MKFNQHSDWREIKLGDALKYRKDRIKLDEISLNNYISTENLLPNYGGKRKANGLPKLKTTNYYQKNDILVSNIRPYFKKIWRADRDGGASSDVLVFKNIDSRNNNTYLYYRIANSAFFDYVMSGAKGTKMPRGDKNHILDFKIGLPPIKEQKAIADTLSSLDNKIANNDKINQNLEEQAQTLFRHWFVDFEFPNEEGKPYKSSGGKMVESELGLIPVRWEVKSLNKIADFVNGIAIARYRPENKDDNQLPAIKIRELRQGFTDKNSDYCLTSVDKKYYINDYDMIFSWSGTLLIDIWTGGDAILNQHLFKVTSEEYDQWFYYYWTKYFLDEFIRIAAERATTMGHIKRSHLSEAKVIVPDLESYERIGSVFYNILEIKSKNKKENQKLAELRDTLLPKLMSGELRIPLD